MWIPVLCCHLPRAQWTSSRPVNEFHLSFQFYVVFPFGSMEEDLSFHFRPRFHLNFFITKFFIWFLSRPPYGIRPEPNFKKKIALAKFVSSKNHWWKREEVLCVHRCQIVKFIFDFLNKNISAPSEKFDHWPHFIWLDRFFLNLILINWFSNFFTTKNEPIRGDYKKNSFPHSFTPHFSGINSHQLTFLSSVNVDSLDLLFPSFHFNRNTNFLWVT